MFSMNFCLSAICVVAGLVAHCSAATVTSSTGSYVFLDGNELTLARLALAAGQDTIIIAFVGQMNGTTPGDGSCSNATTMMTNATMEQLASLAEFMESNRMTAYVGLLGVAPGGPSETSDCAVAYASMQAAAAAVVVNVLNAAAPTLAWHWYVPQEPNLSSFGEKPDCSVPEIGYLSLFVSAIEIVIGHSRGALISPYFAGNDTAQVGRANAAMLSCVPGLNISAPQDGVGSFGRAPSATRPFYAAMAKSVPKGSALWANVESFMPPAQLCKACPPQRLAQQVASAAAGGVSKAIQFWAYNLAGAPPCHYGPP